MAMIMTMMTPLSYMPSVAKETMTSARRLSKCGKVEPNCTIYRRKSKKKFREGVCHHIPSTQRLDPHTFGVTACPLLVNSGDATDGLCVCACVCTCIYVCLLDTAVSPAKRRNQSTCRLGCAHGCARETMYLMEGPGFPHRTGRFGRG